MSVVAANLVMEDLEMKALNTYGNRPRMCYRYVDDTIAAIKKTKIDYFHQHLNSLSTHIQGVSKKKFTVGKSLLMQRALNV